jgi:hypothetical protein
LIVIFGGTKTCLGSEISSQIFSLEISAFIEFIRLSAESLKARKGLRLLGALERNNSFLIFFVAFLVLLAYAVP